MIKISIRKGRHYPVFPISLPKIVRKDKTSVMQRTFIFTRSAIYKFNDDDQWDINKLFGFSIGMHHTNSFRFGWRPTNDLQRIEILVYEYRNKVRTAAIHVCEVEIGKPYTYILLYEPRSESMKYTVLEDFGNSSVRIVTTPAIFKRRWSIGYTLGVYFGGNKSAPHNIQIIRCS